jgi:hypothetical protein
VSVQLPIRTTQTWDSDIVTWRTVGGTYFVEAAHSLADCRLATEVHL